MLWQRCEAFSGVGILEEKLEFSALFGGYFCNVGIAKWFLVGVLWMVASSFVGTVVVALDNGPRQRLQQIIIGFGELMQLTHTLSQCTHRIRKAAILRIIVRVQIAFRCVANLFAKCDKFRHGHRANRPVQFHQKAFTVAALQRVFVERLFQAAKFDLNSPPHFVVFDNLFLPKQLVVFNSLLFLPLLFVRLAVFCCFLRLMARFLSDWFSSDWFS